MKMFQITYKPVYYDSIRSPGVEQDFHSFTYIKAKDMNDATQKFHEGNSGNIVQVKEMLEKCPITKHELIEALAQIAKSPDAEWAHSEADKVLLRHIDDEEITNAFNSIKKYYA